MLFCVIDIKEREKDICGEPILDYDEGDGQRQSAVLEGYSNHADNENTHQEQVARDRPLEATPVATPFLGDYLPKHGWYEAEHKLSQTSCFFINESLQDLSLTNEHETSKFHSIRLMEREQG